MFYSTLNARRPGVDVEVIEDYRALCAGGQAVKERIARFLPQNDTEPTKQYIKRRGEAHYRNYLGGIVKFFVAHMFAASFDVRAKRNDESVDPDPFYGEFKENCDGNRCDLSSFMRRRFGGALIDGRSYWVVDLPDDGGAEAKDKAEFDTRKLGDGRLRSFAADEAIDWECDDTGALLWIILHKKEMRRDNPYDARDVVTETWWLYDLTTVTTYQLAYPKEKPPTEQTVVPIVDERLHGCLEVPVVCLDLVEDGLWLVDHAASPQLEHFRLANANAWSMKRTCYSMPVFKVEDSDRPPQMGVGYYLMIGKEEDVEWLAPPTMPFDSMREEVASLKDEIFRIVHQMALGVDNNAAAVGRSADSKAADADVTEVVLLAYGELLREAIEKTYKILGDARGDVDLKWSIEGFDDFDISDTTSLITAATSASTIQIPSDTFKRELASKVAMGLLHDVDQGTKDKIRKEIESAEFPSPEELAAKAAQSSGVKPSGYAGKKTGSEASEP